MILTEKALVGNDRLILSYSKKNIIYLNPFFKGTIFYINNLK